ncbi:MAG TPA: hypothetical protein VF017_03215 [Thermoanaerobaculia bacterium]|nr:hypothetical protein [Thermoanaerobaculia bacterium]
MKLVDEGVEACRRGDWQAGLGHLAAVTRTEDLPVELPARFYSYLGHAMARVQGRRKEGLSLCQHAIRLEFYRGENYYNLAQVYLLGGHRAAAVKAIHQGLARDRKNRSLVLLARELGVRRSPVLPFLSRNNRINVLLGRLRHRLFSPP